MNGCFDVLFDEKTANKSALGIAVIAFTGIPISNP
tara:strand:+ start:498 stop:602 length:105 start_codon:yes stop_codon:yes gene_type:complete